MTSAASRPPEGKRAGGHWFATDSLAALTADGWHSLVTLKKELIHRRSWPARQELRSAVFDYIESFYNRERRHSTLGYLAPREFEKIYIDKDSDEETVKP